MTNLLHKLQDLRLQITSKFCILKINTKSGGFKTLNDLQETPRKFRPELEGIRAVAAFLVACFHIWLGKVSGGVDVFFIVSGFLITSGLITKIESKGSINLLENYLNLAKRLFPLALIVAISTAFGSIFFIYEANWSQISKEFLASIFYFENWRLALDSVNYLAQNNVASPYQHYWALSIQGQFYITWPFIITGGYIIATKVLKMPVRKTLLIILVILFIISLCYSIYITSINQPFAYFNTFARIWEFCLGGILYLVLNYIRLPEKSSAIISWIAILTILFTGLLLPISTLFPGYIALLPTVSVMLIIIVAESSSTSSVIKLLKSPAFQWFGSISYGFYLWHWPILIFYYAFFEVEQVPLLDGLIILLITLGLSVISSKYVEAPIRSLSITLHRRTIITVLSIQLFVSLIFSAGWIYYITIKENHFETISTSTSNYPGALAIYENKNPVQVQPIPALLNLKRDLPSFNLDPNCKTGLSSEEEVQVCEYGELENPSLKIALVGGSHSGHWFPALKPITEKNKFQLNIYYMDGCRFSSVDFGFFTKECIKWNEKIIDKLIKDDMDIVITTANINKQDFIPEGYIAQWEKLNGFSQIIAIRDNPRTLEDPIKCLESKLNGCTNPQNLVLSTKLPWADNSTIPKNVSFIDMSEYFCLNGSCPQVIGNVIVYRDLHHISNTYAKTLEAPLEIKLLNIIQELQ